jgi:hypothetical protein
LSPLFKDEALVLLNIAATKINSTVINDVDKLFLDSPVLDEY